MINHTVQAEQDKVVPFEDVLKHSGSFPLKSKSIDTLQVNIGKMCNQTCSHCHVDAGPHRKEIMTKETMLHCLEAIDKANFKTIDITGGAPELNPHFKWLIENLSNYDIEIIVRTNLTILVSNPSFRKLPGFFKKHKVHLVASLPCYTLENTDGQRGDGVFEKSIEAIILLNKEGYGQVDTLELDFVYNPFGPFLPSDQSNLEVDYKKFLERDYGIHFNHLYTITNQPISRFLDYLIASEQYVSYMCLLQENFNQSTIEQLMCRNLISVGWDGYLYDCDFNQMLEMKLEKSVGNHISNFNEENLLERNIKVGQHCFACTAGAGSSCSGVLV